MGYSRREEKAWRGQRNEAFSRVLTAETDCIDGETARRTSWRQEEGQEPVTGLQAAASSGVRQPPRDLCSSLVVLGVPFRNPRRVIEDRHRSLSMGMPRASVEPRRCGARLWAARVRRRLHRDAQVGFGLSDTARDYRLGWRLTSGASAGFELNLDATRRGPALFGSAAESASPAGLSGREPRAP